MANRDPYYLLNIPNFLLPDTFLRKLARMNYFAMIADYDGTLATDGKAS